MLDISNICRICLKEEDPKLPIFTENDEKSQSKPTLPEKIMSFARVKVVKDDGLPMYICVKCYCQVDTTVEFKKLCEESFHFFTQQLESLSNSGTISSFTKNGALNSKENSDDCDSNSRASSRFKNLARIQSSLKDAFSFSQHWAVPEDCAATNECEEECAADEEPAIQVFQVANNDESWIDNDEQSPVSESEETPAIIKCEPVWDCPNFDLDASNMKYENGSESVFHGDRLNPLELDSVDIRKKGFSKSSMRSVIDKTCKCRSCEMVFSNRREMGFHISVTHRRCATCRKYFFSNKDKDGHKCDETTPEEKAFAQNYMEKIGQCCPLCKKTVKQLRSHLAWHRKRKVKVPQILQDADGVETLEPPLAEADAGKEWQGTENLTDDKVKCHLCDAVCLNEKGFKIHMTCMHRDHRIVYACLVCKSRMFFSKASCEKHMMKKHGLVANGNTQYEFKHVDDCLDEEEDAIPKKETSERNKFKSMKTSRKIKRLIMNNVNCLDHIKPSNFARKQISGQIKGKGKRIEMNHRKPSLRPSHPPFTTKIPIITNNFEVTHNPNGVKLYVCRGCNVNYDRYISAYNHYYTLSKRAAKVEQKQLIIDSKPYNCKFCTLKFSSRSQAMMHRIHAHKYFHKKFLLEKKSKAQGDLAKKTVKSG